MKTFFNFGSLKALNFSTNYIRFFSTTGTRKPELINIPSMFVLSPINNLNKNNLFSCVTSYPSNMDLNILINYVDQSPQLLYLCIIYKEIIDPRVEKINNTQIFYFDLDSFIIFLSQEIKQMNFDRFKDRLHKTLFVSIDYSWEELIKHSENKKIFISGGHTSKRHILSSVQLRLAKICLQIGISDEFIINAFHNNEKLLTSSSSSFKSSKIDLSNIGKRNFSSKSTNKQATNINKLLNISQKLQKTNLDYNVACNKLIDIPQHL